MEIIPNTGKTAAEMRVDDFLTRLLEGETSEGEYDELVKTLPYNLAIRLEVTMQLLGFLYKKIKASLGE
jgi:hypothetical protein